jgi:hypothetical protein
MVRLAIWRIAINDGCHEAEPVHGRADHWDAARASQKVALLIPYLRQNIRRLRPVSFGKFKVFFF